MVLRATCSTASDNTRAWFSAQTDWPLQIPRKHPFVGFSAQGKPVYHLEHTREAAHGGRTHRE